MFFLGLLIFFFLVPVIPRNVVTADTSTTMTMASAIASTIPLATNNSLISHSNIPASPHSSTSQDSTSGGSANRSSRFKVTAKRRCSASSNLSDVVVVRFRLNASLLQLSRPLSPEGICMPKIIGYLIRVYLGLRQLEKGKVFKRIKCQYAIPFDGFI